MGDTMSGTIVITKEATVDLRNQKYRFSVTNADGDPVALLQELKSNTEPMAWISRASRDAALKTIRFLPINDVMQARMVQHIQGTGYLEDRAVRWWIWVLAGGSRGFVKDGIPCWETFTATAYWIVPNLIRDYIKALQAVNQFQLTLPFESRETRDRVLNAITGCPEGGSIGGWDELPAINQEMRAGLIKAVTSAGYIS